jgi:hypothetical protein
MGKLILMMVIWHNSINIDTYEFGNLLRTEKMILDPQLDNKQINQTGGLSIDNIPMEDINEYRKIFLPPIEMSDIPWPL